MHSNNPSNASHVTLGGFGISKIGAETFGLSLVIRSFLTAGYFFVNHPRYSGLQNYLDTMKLRSRQTAKIESHCR